MKKRKKAKQQQIAVAMHKGRRRKLHAPPKEPVVQNYRPPNARQMKTVKILDGWRSITCVLNYEGVPHYLEYILSPKKKVYRFAQSWEAPDILITSDIWAPRHEIRLVRIRASATRRLVKRKLKDILAKERELNAVRRDRSR